MERIACFGAVLSLCLLFSCSSPPKTEVKSASAPPSPIASAAQEDPQIGEKAKVFDRFLRGELKSAEVQALKENCQKNPSDNIFCFSILNQERLEQNAKSVNAKPYTGRIRALRARYKNGKIRNWSEIRFANVNSLLRGLATARPLELTKLEQMASQETKCPNNMAIAIAATREEALPDRVSASDLAALYQKGATCLAPSAPDREVLLTRAGLLYFLSKQYDQAAKALQLSAHTTNTYVGRALYWLYRARQELKDTDGAKLTLEQMKAKYPFSFHTLVALTASNMDPGDILMKSLYPAQRRSQQATTVNTLIEQVEILRQFHYEASAAKVLDWSISESTEVEPEVRLYLAELKENQGDYRSKITILSDVLYKNPDLVSKQTMEHYFPKVYFPIFEKNSSGLDPFLLLSVARQESAFNVKAISSANAKGLLQVHPATGRRFNRNKYPNLMDPELNIQIGSKYLIELLKRMNGQIHLVLAAYNAGEGHISTWTNRYVTSEPILFIDLIPFRETRDYVASVLRNYYWYRRIHQANENKPLPKQLFELDLTKSG